MSDNNGNFFKGLLIGSLIGTALGILFAPRSGRETRKDLAGKADELLAKAKKEYEKVLEKSEPPAEDSATDIKAMETASEQKAVDEKNKTGGCINQKTETVRSTENRFKKAIDAGLEAYRKETSKNPA